MPETKPIFNRVARYYDMLNTLFSFGIDKLWRRKLAENISSSTLVLDIATGTAEVAIEIARQKVPYVIGLDPSPHMLKLAQKKINSLRLGDRITLIQGLAEDLPFRDGIFDAVTIAFGIRNTINPLEALCEMKRVLKPGGKIGVLEFAVPQKPFFSPIYMFYIKNILPLIGSIFGRKEEYRYLADSIQRFPQRDSFSKLMNEAGFKVLQSLELTMGAVIIYIGIKES